MRGLLPWRDPPRLARLAVVDARDDAAALGRDVVAGDDADGGAVGAAGGLAVLAHGGDGGPAGEEGGDLQLDAPRSLLRGGEQRGGGEPALRGPGRAGRVQGSVEAGVEREARRVVSACPRAMAMSIVSSSVTRKPETKSGVRPCSSSISLICGWVRG